MGFFFTGYNLLTVAGVAILVLALILLNELTRRNKTAMVAIYLIFPFILIALIALHIVSSPSSKTWFGVVKTFSALAGVWGFLAIRFTKLGKSKFTYYFPVLILGINILEAIVKEVQVYFNYPQVVVDDAGLVMLGGPWNLLNALAGLLLVLSMTGFMGIKIAKNKNKDMVWPDQLWFWIIAYDLWNISYCYNCISTRAMYSGMVLIISCTIAEFCSRKGVWLQHRAQTLAIFGMFSLAVDYQAMDIFAIKASYNPKAWLALSVVSLLCNAGVFFYEMYVIYKYKRNPLKEEMFTHLNAYKENLVANNL